jgi:hypothetical protein
MQSNDWSKIKFLESTANLRVLLKRATGRVPSTQVTRDIAACLQQGRLFFEIAASAPLQVQPLQIYYGMVGFAKAMVLARSVKSIATIAQSHGLSDISQQKVQIENLCLRFQSRGVFQQFNDALATLGRVNYFDDLRALRYVSKPYDRAESLKEGVCTLKDILARVPGLQALYRKTFTQEAGCLSVSFYHDGESAQLRIDDPYLFKSREDLQLCVKRWRDLYPWLNSWCLTEASHARDNSVLLFYNIDKSVLDEFSAERLVESSNGFIAVMQGRRFVPFESIVPPLAGGISKTHPTAIQPLNGATLSEHSLQFCGAFLLSSLVRYRPQVWQHALSHTAVEQSGADDRALALVESFLQQILREFPTLVENVFELADPGA